MLDSGEKITIPRPINTSPLTIGDARAGNYEWFSGSIDDIRIFNRALSASEVQTFYHEGGWPVLPTITSISPPLLSPASSVTITGSGFSSNAPDNIVYFGAVKAAVTSASPSSITATVPRGPTLAPVSVTVAGLRASSPVPFIPTFNGPGLINNATLAPKVDFQASGQLVRGTAADLDGDGKPDIAVANAGQKSQHQTQYLHPGNDRCVLFCRQSRYIRGDDAVSGNSL